MKNVIFVLLFIFPVTLYAQATDSVKIALKIDSLLKLEVKFAKEGKWEESFQIIEQANQMILNSFGTNHSLYAKVLFSQGRNYNFLDKSIKAEKYYLEALALQEKLVGKENADYAKWLANLSTIYTEKGQYSKAETLLLECRAIQKRLIGTEDPAYINTLINLGNIYWYQGQYDTAEPFYLESKDISERIFGRNHPKYATILYNSGLLYSKMEQYAKAEPFFLECKDIREQIFGKNHPAYAACLERLGLVYLNTDQYKRAEPFFLESTNINENIFGVEHLKYSASINNLALLYYHQGQYAKAEPLFLESKKIKEHKLGKDHPDYATSLNNLAGLYKKIGKYENVETLYIEALEIREKIFGKNHIIYTSTLSNLAVLNLELGKYKKSEELFLECQRIQEQILGKNHPSYAATLNNIANVYHNLGQYKKVESLYLQSMDIYEQISGKEHSDYTSSHNNLALLYKNIGQYEKAKKLLLENLKIKEVIFGKEHPEYATSLSNLAIVYKALMDYETAEDLYLESLKIKERVFGKSHPEYASSISSLAYLYYDLGDYEKSEKLLSESLNLLQKIFGKNHPEYISTLHKLANLKETLGQLDSSDDYRSEALELQQNRLSKSVSFLSENELSNYIQLFQANGNKMLDFTLDRHIHSINLGQLSYLCYNNSLFYKGFLLNSSLKTKQLISKSPKAEELNNEIKSSRRRLAQQYAKTIEERDSALITELEEKTNTTEKQLAREVSGYADATQQFDWKDVQSTLKKGEAAIEFVHFKVNFQEKTDSMMYAALLLLPDGQLPSFIPLFEEKNIRMFFQLESESGDAYSENINTIYDEDWGNYKNLYDLIWQPLDSLLQGVDRIYYSPTGLLHKVAFAALPVAEDRRLVDIYDLQLVTSTRDIIFKAKTERASITSVALFGDVDYKNKNNVDDTELLADITDNRSILKCKLLKKGNTIPSLPGSAREIQFLQKLFEKSDIDSAEVKKRTNANESNFKRLGTQRPSPSILHLSTHGFFFELTDVSALNCADSVNSSWEAIITSENPLLRSGLLMSGAEQSIRSENNSEGDDGILTALEIANVDLSNTQLAVLSACETGLGDIEGNEGVYGLQRAFKMAGVDYILMTLWKVHDETTNEFMQSFYTHLLQNTPPNEALQLAQNEIRKKKPHPFYWAGFVLL